MRRGRRNNSTEDAVTPAAGTAMQGNLDKIMRMPETSFIQRKSHCNCGEYDDEHIHLKPLSVQAKGEGAGTPVSDSVGGGIKSTMGNGSSMDSGTKTFMENRFGTDFGGVKIHTDDDSAQLNRSLNAKAFTVNNDIWFNSNQYQPRTDAGKHLLAHELTHVVQQKDGASFIQRAPTQTINPANRQIPQGPISRQDFDQYVMNNFGVTSVSDGTQQQQEASIQKVNGPKASIPGWQTWSPSDPSEDYSHIIKAIEDFAGVFSVVPIVKTITFFYQHYETDKTTGVGIPDKDVGADFGAGELRIYKAFSSNRAFPIARSNKAGKYPSVTIAISSPGSSPGAPSPYQPRDKSIKENIVHELGHGVAEAAIAADPNALINFAATAGWVGTNPEVLYDIGQKAVQSAFAKNATPPAQYIIDENHWNDPKWIEQPMSNYSVKGGSAEDFAECIAAYVYAKSTFAARAPARFKYIDNGLSTWKAKMNAMPAINPNPPATTTPAVIKPPLGDFPISDEIRHTA